MTPKQLRYLYITNRDATLLIDSICEIVYNIARAYPITKKYKDALLKIIIHDYLLIGRVAFDYFIDDNVNVYKVYDPDNLRICPIPNSSVVKVVHGNETITDRIIYLRRSLHPYDYLGCSIIQTNQDGEMLGIYGFSFDQFIVDFQQALLARGVVC